MTINFHRMTPHTYWLGLCLLVLCINQPAYSADIWLSNAQLIDGTGKTEIRSVNVHVTDNRIVEITEASTRSGAIDLQGAFLLPGYIDAHAHIEDPVAAERALLSGVTTARVLGDVYLKGLGTRDLIQQNNVSGPELLVSAGHVRPVLGESFILSYPQFGRYYKTPLKGDENVREVVRAVIARGADVIKVGASERAGLASTDPRRPELSYDEIRAAVQEASKKGLFVAAHSHGQSGVNAAVRAGVRSIEHGTYVDDDTLQLMKKQGTFFVPTLAIMSPLGDPQGNDAESIALQVRTHHMMQPLRQAVRKAHALGIVVAGGTDGSYGDGDDSSRVRPGYEMEELIACGFTPLEAITAMTFNSASVLGIESRTGSIAVGMEADLQVVARDPRVDTSTLFEPMLILNNGRVVLNRIN
ncbi:MAG: amidohydrolase family protein [Arenimonas sp.]|nr:amidohydrolase family protein [Arenimonas sp.]